MLAFRKHHDEEDFWIYSFRKPSQSYDEKYKIHISIDPLEFDRVEGAINSLLDSAIADGIFNCYKVYKVTMAKDILQSNAHPLRTELEKDPICHRQMHSPFVIYLYGAGNEDEIFKISGLIYHIECLLNTTRPGNVAYRAPTDLPLTTHTIFRQAYLNDHANIYISSFDSTHASTLVSQAKQSNHYKALFSFPMRTAAILTQHLYEISADENKKQQKLDENYNQTIIYVIDDILTCDHAVQRAARIEQWARTIALLIKQENFHSASAIYNALNDPAIKNLKLTQYNLSQATINIFENIRDRKGIKEKLYIRQLSIPELISNKQNINKNTHPCIDKLKAVSAKNIAHLTIQCANQENSYWEHVKNFYRNHSVLTVFTFGLAALFYGIHTYRTLPTSSYDADLKKQGNNLELKAPAPSLSTRTAYILLDMPITELKVATNDALSSGALATATPTFQPIRPTSPTGISTPFLPSR